MDERVEAALKGVEFKRACENHMGEFRKKYGLKKVDVEVLCYLAGCEEYNTPTDIYKRLRLNRGHVSQAIDALIQKNYILAEPDPKDRRSMHYKVREEACGLICELTQMQKEMERIMFDGITEEELQVYQKVCLKILDNMSSILK